jgi:hypothetical protein
MVSISVKAKVTPDGALKLEVPTGLPETDVEVLIVVQPVGEEKSSSSESTRYWPEGFFEQTSGCLSDDPLTRHPQGDIVQSLNHPISF